MRHVTVVLEIVLREHFDDLGGKVARDVILPKKKDRCTLYVEHR